MLPGCNELMVTHQRRKERGEMSDDRTEGEKQNNFRTLDHDSCNNCNHARVLTGLVAYMWQCSVTGLVYSFIGNPPGSRICDKHER